MKFVNPKSGWKTYAVVVIAIGMGVAETMGVHIPSWVDWVLAFLGLGTLRHAVTTQSAKAAREMEALVKAVIETVTIPDPNTDTTGAVVKTIPVQVHVLPDVKPEDK